MKKFVIISFLLWLGIHLSAQDKICFKTGDTVKVAITEITNKEIICTPPGQEFPIFSFNIKKVASVILNEGVILEYYDELLDPNLYHADKKTALKMDFFSPTLGYFDLAFEKSITPSRSIEFDLGILGLGTQILNGREGVAGVGFKFGYKYFLVNSDFYARDYDNHILSGIYFKPEIATSIFGYSKKQYSYNGQSSKDYFALSAAVLFTAGHHMIIVNELVIDFYFGLGYGINSNSYDGTEYMYNIISRDMPLTFMGGIKLGKLLGNKNSP